MKLPEVIGASTAPGTSRRSTRAMLSAKGVASGEAFGVVTSTHSNSHSMSRGPRTLATWSLTSSWVISGRMRQSMHASARVGMTLTALPAWSTVGVMVAPKSGSMRPATTGSSARSSAPAARAVCGSLRRAAKATSGTRTSMKRAVVPETIAGGSARPRAMTARARSMTALRSFSGTDP